VIGAADQICGEVPIALLVLKNGVKRAHGEITREVVQIVENTVGAFAELKKVVVVPRLPKTRSGKILRGPMHKLADGIDFRMPATIEDPGTLAVVKEALSKIGYASSKH
jgi:propionyl-CoA synthetase